MSKYPPDWSKCPLCTMSKLSLLHRLWSCPDILDYWNHVELFAATITGHTPHNNIFPLLFGALDNTMQNLSKPQSRILQHNKAWIATCYIAARRAIRKKWTSSIPPTIKDLETDLLNLLKIEKCTCCSPTIYNLFDSSTNGPC